MKRQACSLFVLGVLACGTNSAQKEDGAPSAPRPGSAPTPSAPSVVPTTSAAVPVVAETGTRIGAATSAAYGAYLTATDGRALYLLEEDPRGASTCYEMCTAIWPPLLAGQGPPIAADSAVRKNLLGTIARRGGGSQVSYNGQPLYLYLGDAGAGQGQTRGHHVEDSWGEWSLVSPMGREVENAGSRHVRDRRGSGH